MKVKLVAPPWRTPELTDEAREALTILGDGVWRDASRRFYAEREAKLNAGSKAPKGMQRTLNQVMTEKLEGSGWEGYKGCFIKGRTWLRVTFRHQMSLGTDIVDALKACKREGMELAIILAAGRKTLDVISPNDAPVLVSFEKLRKEISGLNGVIDIPLIIGELEPATMPSQVISEGLLKERPRDLVIPQTEAN